MKAGSTDESSHVLSILCSISSINIQVSKIEDTILHINHTSYIQLDLWPAKLYRCLMVNAYVRKFGGQQATL